MKMILKSNKIFKIIGLLIVLFSVNHEVKVQGIICATVTTIILNGACLTGTINDGTVTALIVSCGSTTHEGWY